MTQKIHASITEFAKWYKTLNPSVQERTGQTWTRVQQLYAEKARLKKHYLSSLAEINSHQKNLVEWLIKENKI